MTADQAIKHLADRAARTCDARGNRGNGPGWNSSDVEAVHVLEREIATRPSFTCIDCLAPVQVGEQHECPKREWPAP